MRIKSTPLKIKRDDRGNLVEVIKPSIVGKNFKGQVFITTAFVGSVKGNHFHKRKTEWYCVIKGRAQIVLIENKTKKKSTKTVSGQRPEIMEIPPNVFHYIKNIGEEEMYLLVYVDEEFNAKDTDTYFDLP